MKNRQSKIIFVSGVHGVGKTTLSKAIASKLKIQHCSASDLIKKYCNIEYTSKGGVKRIEQNQEVLIKAVDVFLNENMNYILDGHFCLLDENSKITKIPLSVFKMMAPAGIIQLCDNSGNVYSRLRDGKRKIYNVELLDSIQIQEKRYSQKVSQELNIPYLSANPSADYKMICEFIRATLCL